MERLKKIYCNYEMVCEAPSGGGVEIVPMPEFFDEKKGVEADYAHVHNFFEIIWFKEGEGVHYVDFNEYPVVPGSLFCISPGQVHTFGHKHDGQCGYVIKVCDELLSDLSGEDMAWLKFNVFNADTVPCFHIGPHEAEKLDNIIQALRDEALQTGSIGHKDYLRSLVRMLIIRIERSTDDKEHQMLNVVKPSHKAFLTFRQLVEENFRTLHTVKDYAEQLCISTKTLTNYVAECSPLSPLEIINNRIIVEAKRLLRYSPLMVKEIAYDLGFDDPSYFVKYFKRQTGLLPADFRREYMNNRNISAKERNMKIAIPTRDGIVDSHFGHCAFYTIVEVDAERRIVATTTLDSPEGCGCKSNIAAEMAQMGVTLMLAGNIGQGAVNKLSQSGIEVIKGCSGPVEQLAMDYLAGRVKDQPQVCDHHDCAHHGDSTEPAAFTIKF